MSVIRIDSLANAQPVAARPAAVERAAQPSAPVPSALEPARVDMVQQDLHDHMASYGSWSALRDHLRAQSRQAPLTA